MFQNYTKIRRHAERLAGQSHGSKHPDVNLWANRLRKAIVAGQVEKVRRQGNNGDYLVTKIEVDRWFRRFVREVGVAAAWTFMILSPMLLPGGAL